MSCAPVCRHSDNPYTHLCATATYTHTKTQHTHIDTLQLYHEPVGLVQAPRIQAIDFPAFANLHPVHCKLFGILIPLSFRDFNFLTRMAGSVSVCV